MLIELTLYFFHILLYYIFNEILMIMWSEDDIYQTPKTMKSMPDSRRCNVYKDKTEKVLEEI